MEEAIRMAAVPRSTHYRFWGPTAHHWLRCADDRLDKSAVPFTSHSADRILIACVGCTIHLPRPRRPLRPHPLRLRAILLFPPRRAHHPTEILPQIQAHSENPPDACRRLCHLPLYLHGRRHLYAPKLHIHRRRHNRSGPSRPTTILPRTLAAHPDRLLNSLGVHTV